VAPTTSSGLPAPVPVVYGEGRVPGVIEAEDYNTGGSGVAYYDTTPSNFGGVYRNENVDIELSEPEDSPVVCWIRPGEWLKYTVNVDRTGYYDVVFRVSSQTANTQIRLQVDGVEATTFTVPNTGDFEKYTNVTKRVKLNSGAHVLRLVFGGYQNINYMQFGYVGTSAYQGLDPAADLAVPTPTVPLSPTATGTVTTTATPTPIATVTPLATTPKTTVVVTPLSTPAVRVTAAATPALPVPTTLAAAPQASNTTSVVR